MTRYFPLLLLLVLLGALAASQVATAASPARPNPSFAHPTLRDDGEGEDEDEEEFIAEDDEFGVEMCEATTEEPEFEGEDEEEFEGEEVEASCGDEEEVVEAAPKGAPFVTAPAACQVRQAESTITTLPGSGQVRLTIHYLTYAPSLVTVGLKLKDHKGAIPIEPATKQLGSKGVLHFTARLGDAVMERALAASEFDVSLRATETPGFCAGALEQRLHSVKHTGPKAPRVYAD
jgi:hypothetical protein